MVSQRYYVTAEQDSQNGTNHGELSRLLPSDYERETALLNDFGVALCNSIDQLSASLGRKHRLSPLAVEVMINKALVGTAVHRVAIKSGIIDGKWLSRLSHDTMKFAVKQIRQYITEHLGPTAGGDVEPETRDS